MVARPGSSSLLSCAMSLPVTLKKLKLNSFMKIYKTFRTNTPKGCPFHYRGLECKIRKKHKDYCANLVLIIWTEAGQRLIEFCQENALVKANTLFQQHKRRLYTWTSPDGQHRNQIERDGNTRPPDLPLEKSVCRSGSNS